MMYEAREIPHKLFKLNLKSSKTNKELKKMTFPKVFFLVSEEEAAQGWGRKTQSWSRRRLRNWSGIHTVSTNTERTYKKLYKKSKFECFHAILLHAVTEKEIKQWWVLRNSNSTFSWISLLPCITVSNQPFDRSQTNWATKQ